jgi:cytidine deaminase
VDIGLPVDGAFVASPSEPPSLRPSSSRVRACACSCLDHATSVAAAAAGQPAALATVKAPSPALTERLRQLLPERPFHIKAAEARRIAAELGISVEQMMIELIPIAKASARPPVSNYQVGAVGMGRSGDLYLGVNMEYPGQALNQTVHGEQFVTANAMAHGETGLTTLAVSAEPCGHCRQFLNELEGGGRLKILIPDKEPVLLEELLPRNFGPQNLNIQGGLLTPQDHRLSLPGPLDELARAALAAANRAYAPYSHNAAGIAIQTRDGKIYSGSYAENAAFNPSLSPLQAALVHLVSEGKEYSEITRAVLVEKEALASQEPATRMLLESLAPGAELRVLKAR